MKAVESGPFIYAHYIRRPTGRSNAFEYKGQLGAYGKPQLAAFTYLDGPSGTWFTLLREAPFPASDLIEHDINLPPKVNKP